MRYEKLANLYESIDKTIKNGNYKEATKNIMLFAKSTRYYKILPFNRKNIIDYTNKIIENLKESNSNNFEIYYNLAAIMYFLEKYKKAKIYIKKAIFDNNNYNENEIIKYYLLLAFIYDKTNKENRKEKIIKKIEKINPFNTDLLLFKGKIEELNNNLDKAIYYYNIIIDIDNENAYGHFMKGRCLFLKDNYKAALKELKKSYKLINKDDFAIVDLMTLIAEIYFENKNYKKSFHFIKILTTNYYNRPEIYYVKSEMMLYIGRELEALKLINKGIKLMSKSVSKIDFYYRKANFLIFMSRTEDAIKCLNKALKIDPQNVKILDIYAEILLMCSKYNKAIKIYKKRKSIEHSNHIYYLIAKAYFSIGKYEKAYNYINKFLYLEKEYSEGYILRAKINSIQNYKTLAINDLNKALERSQDENIFLDDDDLFYLSNLEHIEEFQQFLSTIENRNDY